MGDTMISLGAREYRALGTQLAELRKSQNLSQRKLAELCSMNYSQLAKIELGTSSPTIETLSKILSALGYGLTITRL